MNSIKVFFLIAIAVVFFACNQTDLPKPVPEPITFSYDFSTDTEGWEAGFADLPTTGLDIYELEAGHATLPEPLDTSNGALRSSGHNRSDDLFMFWKRRITGLQPLTTYQISWEVRLASQYPTNSAGIGGSPGASVYFKAGATTREPEIVEENVGGTPYSILDIDKGNQSQSGSEMAVLGNIGIPSEEFTYQLITLTNPDAASVIEVQTDAEGACWVVMGTDSGFEGKTTLYYDTVIIMPVAVE